MIDENEIQRLLAEFRAKAEPLGVAVVRIQSIADAAHSVAEWANQLGVVSIIVAAEVQRQAPSVGPLLETMGLQVRPPAAPATTRDAPLGLSMGRLGIAETGSVLLSESSLEDRSVGMLTLAQATLCPTRALVASLDEAAPVLRELSAANRGAFSTLVTGPSRTADIERVLTVGVQGPGKVMTVFVDDL